MKGSKGLKMGIALLVIGLIALCVGSVAMGFDFTRLDTHKYTEASYAPEGEFTSIRIVEDTSDIRILPSEDGTCRVDCLEEKDCPHSVQVNNGELVIENKPRSGWQFWHFMGFHLKKMSVTVYLPKESYDALVIDSSTGDITIADQLSFDSVAIALSTGDTRIDSKRIGSLKLRASTGDAELSGVKGQDFDINVSTGHIKLSGIDAQNLNLRTTTGRIVAETVRCESFTAKASTGKVQLRDVIAQGALSVSTSTGDIKLEACDAASLSLTATTGNISGELLSEKIFFAHSDTGRINVPETRTGGECRVKTDTGSIRFSVR